MKFRSVSHLKSSKNEVNSRVNLSSIRFLNSDKIKFSDYDLEQIFDENKYYDINKNIKKCMSNNFKNNNKSKITLKNNENKGIKKNLTYEKRKIIPVGKTNYKNDKKSNLELFNNLFTSKDNNDKNNNNICSII